MARLDILERRLVALVADVKQFLSVVMKNEFELLRLRDLLEGRTRGQTPAQIVAHITQRKEFQFTSQLLLEIELEDLMEDLAEFHTGNFIKTSITSLISASKARNRAMRAVNQIITNGANFSRDELEMMIVKEKINNGEDLNRLFDMTKTLKQTVDDYRNSIVKRGSENFEASRSIFWVPFGKLLSMTK